MQKEHIKLSEKDQGYLMAIISKGETSAKIFRRATALLELNRGKSLVAVASTLEVSRQSVSAWRKKYQSVGLGALEDAPRQGRPPVIDGKQRASITYLACCTPPSGHSRWTLRLLADKVVEFGFCQQLSHTQARKILKKTSYSRT